MNGLLRGIYSGHWQNLHVIKNDGIKYEAGKAFVYPLYPDWSFASEDKLSMWRTGKAFLAYTYKPEQAGLPFREQNPDPLPEISVPDAKIYLMLSDPFSEQQSATRWTDYFIRPGARETFMIGDFAVDFSEPTENAIRYAVLPYSDDIARMLYSQNYTLAQANAQDETSIPTANLNYVIVW